MKTCVQIGLNRSAEYMYLANNTLSAEDVLGPMENPVPPLLPEGITVEPYKYWGVDSDPDSIAFLASNFPPHPCVHFACCHLIPRGAKLVESCVNFGGYYGVGQKIYSGGCSLSLLFRGLAEHHLEFTEDIEFLAMDIEGAEYDVFESYDWILKPRVIRIEGHLAGTVGSPERLERAIVPRGYRVSDIIYIGEEEVATIFQIDFIRS